jgi:hypothetical protein
LPDAYIAWRAAVRIIGSRYPPIDLFEDIADPADWPLIISAEQKTNPRLITSIGNLDLVPEHRRVAGPGASYLMAPFTHISKDRPSRFSDGSYGVLYVAHEFETALFETMHHHARFMADTNQEAGWTSQFRELVMDVTATLHDCRILRFTDPVLSPSHYNAAQALSARLRASGSDGIVYPSVRKPGGECVGLFYPDLASLPIQGRHLDYHWDGVHVDFYRDAGSREVFAIR